jgi:hypothetical protein
MSTHDKSREQVVNNAVRVIRDFLRDLSQLSPEDLSRVIDRARSADDTDIVAFYAMSATRLISNWLKWEERCSDKSSSSNERFCKEIEESARSHDKSIGVVTYFNSNLRRLLVKFYNDYSPGLLVPRWIIMYSIRMGMPLVDFLKKLDMVEQAIRLPYFLSFIDYIDSLTYHKLRFYSSSNNEFAYLTSLYIYNEVVEPCSVIVYAYNQLVQNLLPGLQVKNNRALLHCEQDSNTAGLASIKECISSLFMGYYDSMLKAIKVMKELEV